MIVVKRDDMRENEEIILQEALAYRIDEGVVGGGVVSVSVYAVVFFFSSRRRHTRYWRDWSSDVCSSDLPGEGPAVPFAKTLVQRLPLPRLTIRVSPDPGLVAVPARFWIDDYQGQPITDKIGRASCRERV